MLSLIYYIELSWLLIDTLSGYFLNKEIQIVGNMSLGSMFRLLLVPIFLYVIAKYADRNTRQKISILMAFAIFISCIHVLYYQLGFAELIDDFQFNLKLLMPILFYSLYNIQFKNQLLSIKQVNNMIWFNSSILLVNLYLGILGFGFGSYGVDESGEMLGSKGFFYAGNEVSASLIALFALTMYSIRQKLSKNALFASFILVTWLIAALSLITKTAILGFIIISIYFYYKCFSLSTKLKVLSMFLFLVLITSSIWLPIVNIAIDRWDFFYSTSSDFLSFLTSGRSLRLDAINVLLLDPFSLFFGHGVYVINNQLFIGFESDLLDMIAISGFFGLIVFLLWTSWAFLSFKMTLRNKEVLSMFPFLFILIFLLLSLIAGHVLYSTMAAPFIAMILFVGRFSKKS